MLYVTVVMYVCRMILHISLKSVVNRFFLYNWPMVITLTVSWFVCYILCKLLGNEN